MCDGWFDSANLATVDDETIVTAVDRKKDMTRPAARTSRPAKWVVFFETLPKNPSGKLLKRELRATLDG